MFYDDDAKITYRRTDRSTFGHGELIKELGREDCSDLSGALYRIVILYGEKWYLDSAYDNNNKFNPETEGNNG